MKQLRIFLWLKIKEVVPALGLALGILGGCSVGALSIGSLIIAVERGQFCVSIFPCWVDTSAVILGFFASLAIVGILFYVGYRLLIDEIIPWIKANWEEAGNLAKKKKVSTTQTLP